MHIYFIPARSMFALLINIASAAKSKMHEYQVQYLSTIQLG